MGYILKHLQKPPPHWNANPHECDELMNWCPFGDSCWLRPDFPFFGTIGLARELISAILKNRVWP